VDFIIQKHNKKLKGINISTFLDLSDVANKLIKVHEYLQAIITLFMSFLVL
jgi:hypothetical protein